MSARGFGGLLLAITLSAQSAAFGLAALSTPAPASCCCLHGGNGPRKCRCAGCDHGQGDGADVRVRPCAPAAGAAAPVAPPADFLPAAAQRQARVVASPSVRAPVARLADLVSREVPTPPPRS